MKILPFELYKCMKPYIITEEWKYIVQWNIQSLVVNRKAKLYKVEDI
jgi:hypothetical protein